MNTNPPFAGSAPALRLPRRAAASGDTHSGFGADIGGQLAADLDALREREANLRDYEARLRNWQAQLDAAAGQSAPTKSGSPFLRGGTTAPFAAEGSLDEAWQKFYRARALLEAEQKQMRDERIALRETEVALKRREAELAEREARLAAREQPPSSSAPFAADAPKGPSAVQRFTQAPFLAAKAVFKGGR